MRLGISAFAVAATLTIISTVSSPASAADPPTTNTIPKDAATHNVPDLITPAAEDKIPYRPCINARGWVNGRLVCSDHF
jgi:hypothetical protein